MLKRFVFEREDQPGEAWLARFAGRQEAERWHRGEGLAEPPSAVECRVAISRHMPELLAHYDRACALVGDDDMAHRILSHYRPPPEPHGCIQAIWLGDGGPALVRNYDYALDVVSDRFEITSWSGRKVIAKAQRPWGGCIDGMNEDGLVASLTFGGGSGHGLGFSIILILRYLLETCRHVDQAIAALSRIPVATSQNVTLLDRSEALATVFLGPDRKPAVSRSRTCANHQEITAAQNSPAIRNSIERERAALAALDEPAITLPSLTARFLKPPLYSRRAAFPTVYTAVYRPAELRVDYIWPGATWSQRIGRFDSGAYAHDYGELAP